MKYFEIDETQRYHSLSELQQHPGFSRKLNSAEMFMVLEEQLRSKELQPYFYPDFSGFEIQPASKKFMQQRGSHSRTMSRRAIQYMEFCDGMDMNADQFQAEKPNSNDDADAYESCGE